MTGEVVPRAPDAVNPRLATGAVELAVRELTVLSAAEPLPLQVASDAEFPEETRLRYRFLDLRREKLHANIVLRSRVISSIRRRMIAARVHRVPDADLDLELAGGGARLPRAEPRASGHVLRAAAGATAVQAAPDGGRVRPVLPDRARASGTRMAAPTDRRASSTSSTSRCPSSPRRTSGGPSSRCCTACSRNSRTAGPSRRRRSRASPSTRRWRSTGRTSRT